MLVTVSLVLFLALGFAFIVQRFSSDLALSRIWKGTYLHCAPRKHVPDSEIKLSQDVKPYQFPHLRERTSTKMAMGLKRLDESNWLTLDSNYLPEHVLRCSLLCTNHPQVIQCLPGSEAACREVLSIVTSFLSYRFSQHFTVTTISSGPAIHNHLTNEIFPIGQRNCSNPLEVAARLSMEDFNVLIRNPETGEYHLQASATLFPAGWKLQERVGTSMANLHAPVPGWKEKLGRSVNRYFDHLSSKTSMERTNLFIQTTPDLFQDTPEIVPKEIISPKKLMVRRERQTFTRLPDSGAILFTVRTIMTPLVELSMEELKALRSQVMSWEEETKVYKGWDIWGEPLLMWCKEMVGREERKVGGIDPETGKDIKSKLAFETDLRSKE